MTTVPKIPDFPEWLQSAVRHEATRLWSKLPTEKDPIKAQKVLTQLISNPLMKRVWDELYKNKIGNHRGFLHPARLTNSSKAAVLRERAHELREKGGDKNDHDADLLEFEARLIQRIPEKPADPTWSEQERAVQSFLAHAYRAALENKPKVFSEIQIKVRKLQQIADSIRKISKELESIVGPIYAATLMNVADECDDDARIMEPRLGNEPWIVVRRRGDVLRKTFVARLSYATHFLFAKTLHNTIANVTNVVFGSEHTASDQVDRRRVRPITGENVREMLRVNAQQIQPSFGPLIIKAQAKEIEAELASRYGAHWHPDSNPPTRSSDRVSTDKQPVHRRRTKADRRTGPLK